MIIPLISITSAKTKYQYFTPHGNAIYENIALFPGLLPFLNGTDSTFWQYMNITLHVIQLNKHIHINLPLFSQSKIIATETV
jgi:hypothetical protein